MTSCAVPTANAEPPPRARARSAGLRALYGRLRGALLCALLAGCATPPPSLGPLEGTLYENALDLWLERSVQLQSIHERIRVAAAELCGSDVSPALGLVAVRPRELPAPLVRIAARRFGAQGRPLVLGVAPGSAGERAGILPGDRVLRVGLRRVVSTRAIYSPPHTPAPSLAVKVLRDGRTLDLEVANQPGCDYRVELVDSDGLNAYALGKKGMFLAGLLRMLGRDEAIAFVIGHELAHYIAYRATGKRSRDVADEVDADYLGAHLAERAGYHLSLADFERVRAAYAASELGADTPSTHPPTPQRAVRFGQTLAEIERERERGEPLRLPRAMR